MPINACTVLCHCCQMPKPTILLVARLEQLGSASAHCKPSESLRWHHLAMWRRWVSLRLQVISIAVVFATAVLVVTLLADNPGLAGLAMTSALSTTGVVQWVVRQATRLEVQMNRQAFRPIKLINIWTNSYAVRH